MKLNAQQSAYVKGFDVGLSGESADVCPYKGHTAGYLRGLKNQWGKGWYDGDIARSMLASAQAKRDKADTLQNEGDNAMVRENYAEANELWFKAAHELREAAGDMKYHVNLMKRRNNPD